MTKFNTSLSAFVPNTRKDRVNLIMQAMGFGPDNFSVPLSVSGLGTATMWGLHAADDGKMQALLDGTTDLSGLDFADLGFSLALANAAIAAVVLHSVLRVVGEPWNRDNFDIGMVNRGMKLISKIEL